MRHAIRLVKREGLASRFKLHQIDIVARLHDMHAYMHTYIGASIFVYIYIYIHVYLYIYIYNYTRISTYRYVCISICVYVYSCLL